MTLHACGHDNAPDMLPEVPERDPSVGAFVRERRRRAKLTQQDLANLTGVGKRFIVELEDDKPTLRLDKVNQVLAAFGKRLGPVDVPRRVNGLTDPGGRGE